MVSRRTLLKTTLGGVAAASLPSLGFAQANTEARLVLIVLRGAADGLAIAAPFGEPEYARLRGELALPGPGQSDGLLKLDGLFGLHPSLTEFHAEFQARRALLVHAVASPYRSRSHFDGQDVLESGAAAVGRLRDGWLNRALTGVLAPDPEASAIALAPNLPLVLRGANPATSWAPSQLPDADPDTLARLTDLYADDRFFATRLADALRAQDIAAGEPAMDGMRSRGNDLRQLLTLTEAAARFLGTDDGPRVAVLEAGGWDTHANQGASNGALANRLAGLDTALGTLRDGLGALWQQTVVAVVTEFGRTVAVNGTRGTDHGTGAAALLLGGALDGGRVVSDWPGIAQRELLEGRDLLPTTDLRSVFKALLIDHLGEDPAFVEQVVFPDSQSAKPIDGLLRSPRTV